MLICVEVEASEAGFEMAVFFRLRVQRSGGFKVFVLWQSLGSKVKSHHPPRRLSRRPPRRPLRRRQPAEGVVK
jgi:hypothetical protein